MGEPEDEAFTAALDQARAGDPAALWRASEALRPYLQTVARALLAGRLSGKVDPADVVQQSLLSSVERFDQFRGDTPAEWQRWLVAIVRNESKNLLRFWHQQRRRVSAEEPVAGSRAQAAPEDGISVRLPGAEPSASRRVAARREASRLLEELDRMPPDMRAVLTLRHFEGLSHLEIAERLGISPEAARQKWVRALRGLKRRLGEGA